MKIYGLGVLSIKLIVMILFFCAISEFFISFPEIFRKKKSHCQIPQPCIIIKNKPHDFVYQMWKDSRFYGR